jgi:DedD protein
MAEQQQDVDTLKRRGRRRLVGAVALVLLAVIVLPMVFDPEPRRSTPPVSVRIPGEDDSAFAPKVPSRPAAKPTEKKIEEKKADEQKAEDRKPEEKGVEEKKPPEAKAAAQKPEAKRSEAERARAEAALANAEYVIPVGAFTNPDPVIAKLAEAKLRYYTETMATAKGTVTRVRAGPFATKDEAEKALEILKGLGLKPGNVGTKAG